MCGWYEWGELTYHQTIKNATFETGNKATLQKVLWTRETGQGRVGDIILVRWRCVDLGRGEDTKQDKCLLLQMAERDHHRGSCLPDKTLGICLKLPNLFVSNWQMYLYQIDKYICRKLQDIFVEKYICFKLPTDFVKLQMAERDHHRGNCLPDKRLSHLQIWSQFRKYWKVKEKVPLPHL